MTIFCTSRRRSSGHDLGTSREPGGRLPFTALRPAMPASRRLEDLSWTDVRALLDAGTRTVIVMTASLERTVLCYENGKFFIMIHKNLK